MGTSGHPPSQRGGDADAQQLFAHKLRGWRMEQGWSQRQVSLQTGLTEQTVFNWEQGRSLPSYDGLKKLVEASHISADWWLGITNHR